MSTILKLGGLMKSVWPIAKMHSLLVFIKKMICIFILSGICVSSAEVIKTNQLKTEQEIIKNFLEYCDHNKSSLQSSAENINSSNDQLNTKIYFFWTSWCEYCPLAYSDIINWQKKFKTQLSVVGFNLDSEVNDAVRKKVKEMDKIEHYHISGFPNRKFPAFSRTPVLILESFSTKERTAYTGYSVERSQIILKKVNQYVRQEK